MPPEQSSESMAGKKLGLRLACDRCSIRKIKCDGAEHCAQCATVGQTCRRTRTRRQREKGQRVLVSDQYRQKIDGVEERLNTLTDHVRDFQTTLASHVATVQNSSPSEKPTPGISVAHASPPIDLSRQPLDGDCGFEGASSLYAHTHFANQFVENALLNDATGQVHLDRVEALAALKQLSTSAKAPLALHTRSNDQQIPNPVSNHKLDMPPFSAVAVLLKTERENPKQSLSTWLTRFVTIPALTQMCMDVYFAPTCTDSQLIIVSAHLLWLFSAHGEGDISSTEAHRDYAKLCRMALEATISRLPLLIQPCLDSIHALVVGAIHAVGCANSSLAWTLTNKAYDLCQTLGLHRSGNPQGEDPALTHRKAALFWMLYMLEKALSLRLGRSSIIQESDIEISPELSATGLDLTVGYARHLTLSISAARIQGSVYEKLYSPHALSLSPDSRSAAAYGLIEEIEQLHQKIRESGDLLLAAGGLSSQQDHFYSKVDEIVLLSVATLVHRAVPAQNPHSSFNDRCVNTSRQALDLHQQCLTTALDNNDTMLEFYISWSLLYTPFIPLIVVFCDIIETADKTDLSRLQQFATSLQAVGFLSPPAEKLSRLAQVLFNIANRFVELRSASTNNAQTHAQDPSNAGFEIDEYLVALGLAPANQQSTVEGISIPFDDKLPDPATSDFFQADPSQLNDWLVDHQQMLDLIHDQDLQLFGTNYFRNMP